MNMTVAKRIGLTMAFVSTLIIIGGTLCIYSMNRIGRLSENIVTQVVSLDSAAINMNMFKTAARVELKTYLNEPDQKKLPKILENYREYIAEHDQFEEEIGNGIDRMLVGKKKMRKIWDKGMATIMPEFAREVETALLSHKRSLHFRDRRVLKFEELQGLGKKMLKLLNEMEEANSGNETITVPIMNMKLHFIDISLGLRSIGGGVSAKEKTELGAIMYKELSGYTTEFEKWEKELLKAATDSTNSIQAKKISDLHDEYLFLATGEEQLFDLLDKEKTTVIERLAHSARIDKLGKQDWDMAQKIIGLSEENVNASRVKIREFSKTVNFGILIGVLCIVFISLLTVFVTFRTVINPLRELTGTAEIIGKGDLTKSISLNRHDEIGLLADSFDTMVKKLSEILTKFKEAAAQIISASNEILKAAQQQVVNAREQSAAISETTSAALELSKNAEEIGENIKRVSQVANHSLVGMAKIKDSIAKSSKVISSLSEKSRKIGQITNVIDDVADQTNLLAVNAAIEAARAGEQGRGFTVVADQIQKLADSTANSTKDITDLVELIQHEMSNAVLSMEQSSQSVEEEIKYAQETAEKSKEISMSTTQQVAGHRQIGDAMENINSVMKQVSQSTQQSENAVKQLTHLAKEMGEITNKFKVL